MTIKRIVMWNARGDDAASVARNVALLKAKFESLRGRIRGLLQLEAGADLRRLRGDLEASRDYVFSAAGMTQNLFGPN